MSADQIRVVYRKFDGSLHWHYHLRRLGEDEFGVWLGGPPGVMVQRGETQAPFATSSAQVKLIRPGVWWTMSAYTLPHETEIYCDITTPPQWSETEVVMTDLDLDVRRMRADGRVELLDEDEFAEHQVRYAYPEQVIRQAADAASHLYTSLSAHEEPFATRYQRWLDEI